MLEIVVEAPVLFRFVMRAVPRFGKNPALFLARHSKQQPAAGLERIIQVLEYDGLSRRVLQGVDAKNQIVAISVLDIFVSGKLNPKIVESHALGKSRQIVNVGTVVIGRDYLTFRITLGEVKGVVAVPAPGVQHGSRPDGVSSEQSSHQDASSISADLCVPNNPAVQPA